ncbi:MAG: hypothetical protein AAFQ64_02760 [Pseudomonadota bacterium]
MAAATFAFALSIGYVMQYDSANASRGDSLSELRNILPAALDASPLEPVSDFAPKLESVVVQRAPEVDENVFRADPSSVKLTALVSESVVISVPDEVVAEKSKDEPTCDILLSTAIADDATIVLTVQSPCRGSSPFEVQHNGMVFTAITDEFGQAGVSVPALGVNASLFVTFADGAGATATEVVPDAEQLNRVVLQWDALATDLLQPTDIEASSLGTLQRLGTAVGDDMHFAEVYTFPASVPAGEGLQNLSVHAQVSDGTCGKALTGQTFRVIQGAAAEFKDFQITLPGCEYVGTFLELKKVLGGQTLLPK